MSLLSWFLWKRKVPKFVERKTTIHGIRPQLSHLKIKRLLEIYKWQQLSEGYYWHILISKCDQIKCNFMLHSEYNWLARIKDNLLNCMALMSLAKTLFNFICSSHFMVLINFIFSVDYGTLESLQYYEKDGLSLWGKYQILLSFFLPNYFGQFRYLVFI